MVRRGSTVRVRQRASQKPRKPGLFFSARLAPSPVVREVRRDEAGAIATFLGTVRNSSRDRNVLYLE
jgi:molybdopterin synthase catalytic subunit